MVGHIWREQWMKALTCSWIHFMNLVLVVSMWSVVTCMNIQHMSTGIAYGFPAILTPAITSNSSDASEIHATREEASWIAAMYGVFGPFSYIFLPYVMQTYGRRISNVLWSVFLVLGFVIIAVAPDVTTLIIGRSFQGLSFGGILITSITGAEYSHPKRRPVFVAIKLVIIILGVLFCHSMSMVLTWRQVAWIGTIPSGLGLLTTWAWPESPAWLAYMGRFDDSVATFEWLRGNDAESRKEIMEIISAQKEHRNRDIDRNTFRRIIKMFKMKKFQQPLYISITLTILLHASGAHYMPVYIIEIMKKLSRDQYSAYYYTMGYDAVKIVAALIPVAIIRVFKRRTLIFFTGVVASTLLGLVCVFDYLHETGQFYVSWLIPFLLITFTFVCYLGILPISMALKGEIFPLEFKGIASSLYGIMQCIGSALVSKLTSNMLDSLKIYGTFGVYLFLIVISLVILYFILPETKDRTLQDIETEFIDHKLEVNEVIDHEVTLINPNTK